MYQNATELADFLRSLSEEPSAVVLFVFVVDTTLVVGIVIGFIIKVVVKVVVMVVVEVIVRVVLGSLSKL